MQAYKCNFKTIEMKNFNSIIGILTIVGTLFFVSCEDYLEVEVPNQKIVSQIVFDNDATAKSAMVGIYNQLASVSFSGGESNSVTVLAGLSADNISAIYEMSPPFSDFDHHEIAPDNSANENLWSSAYNIIYATNSLLEGIEEPESNLSTEVSNKLEGESKFVRAFTYFYLVNLYGNVPLITTTDYQVNSLVSRTSKEEVYDKILEDLTDASSLLSDDYTSGERTEVTRAAAYALLARVQLYLQNWEEAEKNSSLVIQNTQYEILQDLNQVFMKNSKEAIWQLSPEGRGQSLTNTSEGSIFIIDPMWYFFAILKLDDSFANSFDNEDDRLHNWVGYNDELGVFFPFKYKISYSTDEPIEYSMVLRLAEQYLIRAEAKARMGDLDGAISDIDILRERAGLDPVKEFEPNLSQNELVSLIMEERNKELFAEWGHRWLDLKRTDRAGEVFSNTTGWETTDTYYPIPESELTKNPNLTQNEGY